MVLSQIAPQSQRFGAGVAGNDANIAITTMHAANNNAPTTPGYLFGFCITLIRSWRNLRFLQDHKIGFRPINHIRIVNLTRQRFLLAVRIQMHVFAHL
jgi:hypothetical protein